MDEYICEALKRHLGMNLPALAETILPPGTSQVPLAGVLLGTVPYRRGQQHVLPTVRGGDIRLVEAAVAPEVCLFSEGEPVHHTHQAIAGLRGAGAQIHGQGPTPGAEAGPGAVPAPATISRRSPPPGGIPEDPSLTRAVCHVGPDLKREEVVTGNFCLCTLPCSRLGRGLPSGIAACGRGLRRSAPTASASATRISTSITMPKAPPLQTRLRCANC